MPKQLASLGVGGAGGAAPPTPISTHSLSFTAASSQYVALGDPSNLELRPRTDAFSISAWVKVGSGAYLAIVGKTPSGQDGQYVFGITSNAQGGKLYWTLGNTSGSASTNIRDGAWHHVVLTVPAATTGHKAYLDGTEQSYDNYGAIGNVTGASNVYLGAYPDYTGSLSQYFDGLLDDVRIFSRELTSGDVTNLHNGVDVTTGLISYWKFDEGSGTSANDSADSNTGTETNGPTYSTDVPAALS